MKTLILLLFSSLLSAQSNIGLMAGYKAAEVSYSYVTENEMIYGLSFSAVDSKVAEKRANNNDKKNHDIKSDYVIGGFGLIGGKFDNLSIIGKLGVGYLEQNINNIVEPQKYYFAVGVTIDHKINDQLGLRGSYDSISSLLVGVTFYLNN